MAANRRIIIAMAMLLVAIFASISVTFAWFSTNTQATAIFNLTIRDTDDNLFVKIESGKGYGHEREDDYSAVSKRLADLNYANEYGEWALVTENGSPASISNYILQPYTLYTNNPRKAVFMDPAFSSVTSGHMALRFIQPDKSYWLNNGGTNENIAKFYGTTDIDETNDRENKIVWRAGEADEAVYYFNTNGYYTTQAANAARIAILPGVFDKLPTIAPTIVWEPNENAGYDKKDENGEYLYEHIASYHKNTNAAEGDVSVDRSAPSNTVDYTVNEHKAVVDQTMWSSVGKDEPDHYTEAPYRAHITVVLWLEGKDADCFNVIGNDTLTANFSLGLL